MFVRYYQPSGNNAPDSRPLLGAEFCQCQLNLPELLVFCPEVVVSLRFAASAEDSGQIQAIAI